MSVSRFTRGSNSHEILPGSADSSVGRRSSLPVSSAQEQTSLQLSPRSVKLHEGLESWCKEKQNTPEYQNRLDAAKKIKKCCASGDKALYLSGTYITSLPGAIGLLTNLETLYLSNTGLTSLPDEIGLLTNLKTLNLSSTGVTSLPNTIELLTNLEELNLSGCIYVTSLPDAIRRLINLKTLCLSRAGLISLPVGIELLINLTTLDLSLCTSLTRLPHGLARLPSHCTINTTYAGLDARSSVEFQDAIAQVRDANPNLGPTWLNTVRENRLPVTTDFKDTFSQYITLITDRFPSENLSSISQEDFINGLTNDEKDLLNTFLNKIKQTQDFKTTRTQGGVLFTILQIFKSCAEVPASKENLFPLIHEALESCGDRIAITLNRIAIELRFFSPELTSNLKDFAHLLITYRRLQLVHEEAARIVKEKRLGDAIEPMLYLQIKLKDPLNLPITTEGMLYPGMAYITKDELEKIGSKILALSTSSDQRMSILCSPLKTTYDERGKPIAFGSFSVTNPFQIPINETWQKALKAKHPEKFQEIEPPMDEEELSKYFSDGEQLRYNEAIGENKERIIEQAFAEKMRTLIERQTKLYIN